MNNQNENENRTIQFGNSLNPNANLNNNNTNSTNMNGQYNSMANGNQNFTMNSQQVIKQENINTQAPINQSVSQQNSYNYSQENLNNNNNNVVSSNDNKKQKSNVKIIIIIVVIVLVIYALFRLATFLISFKTVNSVLDNTRTSAFVSSAKSYIEYAKSLVQIDEVNGNAKYAPSCVINNSTSKITLNEISSNKGNILGASPFGGTYDFDSSYVKVTSKVNNNSCDYEYSIYLTDGTYSIGTSSNPILYSDLSSNSVKK